MTRLLGLPYFVVISWSGGTGAVAKTDWRPLRGKDIVIWADNDKAGFKAANQISTELRKLGVQKLRLVDSEILSKAFPEKWDLADSLPTGKTQQNIKDMITSSKEVGVNPEQVLLQIEGKTSHPAQLSRVNEILWRVDERMRDQLEKKHGNKFWEINAEIVRDAVKILSGEKETLLKIEKEFGVNGVPKERLAFQAMLFTAQHGQSPSFSYLELVKEKIRDGAWLQEIDQKIQQITSDKEIRNFAMDKTIVGLIDRHSSTPACDQKEAINLATELSSQIKIDKAMQHENLRSYSRELDTV